MRYMLILLGLMFVNVAQALECQKLLDCERLGYSQDKDPNCADDGYMYCPFDQNYKVCVQYNCEALGFTQSDKTSWCADLIKCKGNQNMTLCQKPCFATDYNSLKDLAESGHCKVVTMRSDITIPKNESLTLAANTMIDGGNHTLSSSGDQANYIVIKPSNKTGLKNIKIRHTQTETHVEFRLIEASEITHHISLENVEIAVSSDDKTWNFAPVIRYGTYNISGKFVLDTQALNHMVGFSWSTVNFINAQVSINTTGASGDMLVNTDLILTNSTINANISGYCFVHALTTTFENSEANLKGGGVFWSDTQEKMSLTVKESNITLDSSTINNNSKATISLKGATEHPSHLVMKYTTAQSHNAQTDIETSNTTDTVVLNGVSYRPTKATITPLTEVENSQNWKKQ